ncbi:hypothetical protein D9M72_549630 [compost metagenome]
MVVTEALVQAGDADDRIAHAGTSIKGNWILKRLSNNRQSGFRSSSKLQARWKSGPGRQIGEKSDAKVIAMHQTGTRNVYVGARALVKPAAAVISACAVSFGD